MAERVGFEPTVGFPLHSLSRRALSTAQTPLRSFHNRNRRFVSHQCILTRLRLSSSCEKRLQNRRAFIGQDTRGNLHLVIEARVIEHRKARSHSATLGIVASVHQTRHASLNHAPRAHDARFYRHVQCRPGQPIIAELARTFTQYHHLRVRGRIAIPNGSVAGACDDLPFVH